MSFTSAFPRANFRIIESADPGRRKGERARE